MHTPIDPKWRTATVVALCEQMRLTEDFSALPILADALQEADCNDEDLLARLRSGTLDSIASERLVAEIYSEETAAAVAWLESFAVNDLGDSVGYDTYDYARHERIPGTAPFQPMNYHVLMTAARRLIAHRTRTTQRGGENWPDTFNQNRAAFWTRYMAVTGARRVDTMVGLFSCAC